MFFWRQSVGWLLFPHERRAPLTHVCPARPPPPPAYSGPFALEMFGTVGYRTYAVRSRSAACLLLCAHTHSVTALACLSLEPRSHRWWSLLWNPVAEGAPIPRILRLHVHTPAATPPRGWSVIDSEAEAASHQAMRRDIALPARVARTASCARHFVTCGLYLRATHNARKSM